MFPIPSRAAAAEIQPKGNTPISVFSEAKKTVFRASSESGPSSDKGKMGISSDGCRSRILAGAYSESFSTWP